MALFDMNFTFNVPKSHRFLTYASMHQISQISHLRFFPAISDSESSRCPQI